MFSKTSKRLELLTYSMTYAQSPLIMVIPPGQVYSDFSKLMSPFDDSLWYWVNGMMVIIIVIISVVKCQSKETQHFIFGMQNRTPLLNMVNHIFGLPMHKAPGRNFARL
jgi:hypothetical protein